jgi:hypothetical protein
MGNSHPRGDSPSAFTKSNQRIKENLHPGDPQKNDNSYDNKKSRPPKNAEVMEVQKFDVDDDQTDFAASEQLFKRTSRPSVDSSPSNRKDNVTRIKPEPKEVARDHQQNRKEGISLLSARYLILLICFSDLWKEYDANSGSFGKTSGRSGAVVSGSEYVYVVMLTI